MMKRFLVISNHKAEDCNLALKETLAIGYLTHYDWGCKDGVHTGWAVLEAEDKAQALMSVPTFLRSQATVVRLTKFDPAKIAQVHVEPQAPAPEKQ
jgi:ribulose bisphosphate carboxylase small subunit